MALGPLAVEMSANLDDDVVSGFGDEWARFDQSGVSDAELNAIFNEYFDIFPWDAVPVDAVGFDLGCGSGRWAKLVAPRVAKLHLIDPSAAIEVAKRNLADQTNCEFHKASVDNIPLPDDSCDFGYSLGVLHHIPDTEAGLRSCVAKLKVGAPFLLYLYYRFDNRPLWFRAVWRASDLGRQIVSSLPHGARYTISQVIAGGIYFPLARIARLAERSGIDPTLMPLSQYRRKSFYTMRTDALDRFGTKIERRFSKGEMRDMMEKCGLTDIRFGKSAFWTAVGYRRS